MRSSSTDSALRDILRHVLLAQEFVAGMDAKSFHDDARTVLAVIRCLEVISEASRRLPQEVKARHPSIAWRQIAGAGNIYRHNYEDVTADIVWDTVARDLPTLREAVEQELSKTPNRG
jgi:uncharacterized protein with HEPN domain